MRQARLPWHDGDERWSPYTTLVLVFCSVCEKYIAHEERHGCEMSDAEMTYRRVARVSKVKELMNR